MKEPTDKEIVEQKTDKKQLAKISPVKKTIEQDDVIKIADKKSSKKREGSKVDPKDIALEQDLLFVTRLFLKQHGIRKSAAAIRDSVEAPHKAFGPRQAVGSLSSMGFKASFGNIKLSKLSNEFFPLIAFYKDGSSVLLGSKPEDGMVEITDGKDKNPTKIELKQFEDNFSGFVIIAKELSKREKEERSGHWFFSAFRKSKWIYVQVLIAAMVSNFLSLTTALFTMTVYDRIIPNGAFESLIALSIGVIIALAFDFLIKALRAKFIDIASKRADLEISRRLFDRILTLTPAEQRQKTGAMAGTIREFETLREFFNSSTLVLLIDLPFIFFFIYVIYLIAGPLAYVPLAAVPWF